MRYSLHNEQATHRLGADLANCAPLGGVIIYLHGDLGAGKTTLARGFLQTLGVQTHIKSPTYTLVEIYQVDGQEVLHFDLYRLSDPEELEYLATREYLDGHAKALIEWPEHGKGFLPTADLVITLDIEGEGRVATIEALSEVGIAWLAALH